MPSVGHNPHITGPSWRVSNADVYCRQPPDDELKAMASTPQPRPDSKKGLGAIIPALIDPDNWKALVALGLGLSLGIVMVMLLVIKFIAPTFVTPDWVDNRLGLSKRVDEKLHAELTKTVDSGYSRTFIFRPHDTTAENVLPFYVSPGQIPKISIGSTAAGNPHDVKVDVQLDGVSWVTGDGAYQTAELIPISVKPNNRTGNIHEVRFVVSQPPTGGVVIIRCVVLVYNNPAQQP